MNDAAAVRSSTEHAGRETCDHSPPPVGLREQIRLGLISQGYQPPPVFGVRTSGPPRQYCHLRNPPAAHNPATQHATHVAPSKPWTPVTPHETTVLRGQVYRARAGLRRPYTLPGGEVVYPQARRVGACGYSVVAPGGHVAVVVGPGGRASWKGLAQCGSIWACPVCRSKILAGRAKEVTAAVERWGVRRVAMLTLTISHGAGDDLKTIRAQLSDAYRGMTRGASWEKFKRRHGIVGAIRATELTHSESNGWHPHIHVLLFIGDTIPTSDVWEIEGVKRWLPADAGWLIDRWRRMVGRWVDGLGGLRIVGLDNEVKSGSFRFRSYPAAHQFASNSGWPRTSYTVTNWDDELTGEHVPSEARGLVLTPAAPGSYLTKLGLELTNAAASKRTKRSNRNPMEIAYDYAQRHGRDDGKLWRDYAGAMAGARALEWTRGLKDRFGVRDRTDLHVMQDEEPAGGQLTVVAEVPAAVWEVIRKTWTRGWNRMPAAYALLQAVEQWGATRLLFDIDDLLKNREGHRAET